MERASDIDRADYDYHYRKDMEAEQGGELEHRIERLERRQHEINRMQNEIIGRLKRLEEQFGRIL